MPTPAEEIREALHPDLQPLFYRHSCGLPALQATCRTILRQADDRSNADDLSRIVRLDPGLTCKILQLANSVAYSPAQPITSIPHAVTWLGQDIVRALVATTSLVEQLKEWPERHELVTALIVKGLYTAAYATEIEAAMQVPPRGGLFSAALLYSLGDLAIAYQAPLLWHALSAAALRGLEAGAQGREETGILGATKRQVAVALAEHWKLPADFGLLLGTPPGLPSSRWRTESEEFSGLVVGTNLLIEALSTESDPAKVAGITRQIQIGTGIEPTVLQKRLARAQEKARQLVRSVGLPDSFGRPAGPPSARTGPEVLSSSCRPDQVPEERKRKTIRPEAPTPMQIRPLETLREFQRTLDAAQDLHTLLSSFAAALETSAGFVRVGIALLNPTNRDALVGRHVTGVTPAEPYLASLTGSLSRQHPFLASVLAAREPMLVTEFARGHHFRPSAEFLEVWKATSAVLAPLRIHARPIGLIYADRGEAPRSVVDEDYEVFLALFNQTSLSMNRLAGVREQRPAA
ncbi:HDOD domain-containing protein [Nitrospira tepida]|uniref:HDOD domain-containing protein n=1 Tax=Nitrospira tepida TaxID=2973512 RepID=A0AA86MW69_9BACT|nr:HDOD domain-containing protein [Nitrospira tepida]CAI4030161.1 HDOD domain-containing protein [Nitrospira tepida]